MADENKGMSRRTFVNLSAAMPFASMLWRMPAAEAAPLAAGFVNTGAHDFSTRPFSANLYMAFNPINNPEDGESDEFTTIHNLERIMQEMNVPAGTHVIGIGARTGTPDSVYGLPGEMGYFWPYGEEWNGKITNPEDASPMPFGKDDPISVTQVGILDPSTAHRLAFAGGAERGTVMWSLEHDETGYPNLGAGFHNIFSDRDDGMIETLYGAAQAAKNGGTDWATPQWRERLTQHIPDLQDETYWQNFLKTFPRGLLHATCHAYARQQGWQAAAVVLRGKVRNVAQFHLVEWNRKAPGDPNVEIGRGSHLGPLHVRLGRELRPFITRDESDWTMVGFLWDMDNAAAKPGMEAWQDASDIFGSDFHIHGFRDDGKVGGHTLFCMLGDGDVTVDLYPLTFEEGQGAYVFNNDLTIEASSLQQGADGLSVTIRNDGELFARNVSVDLEQIKGIFNRVVEAERQVIPLLQPRESVTLLFQGGAGLAKDGKRRVIVDKAGHFLEGNGGAANNRLTFDANLRFTRPFHP